MDLKFVKTVENGTFYYPAKKRYNNIGYISCDRCDQLNINACVGYESVDLCLNCVNFVVELISKPDPIVPINLKTFLGKKEEKHSDDKNDVNSQNNSDQSEHYTMIKISVKSAESTEQTKLTEPTKPVE